MTRQITAYEFDELTAGARDAACEKNRYINVEDGNWYDYDGKTGFNAEEIKKYGLGKFEECDVLKFDNADLEFDIDYWDYVHFIGCRWSNSNMARKWLGVPKKLWDSANITFDHSFRENTRIEFEPLDSDFSEKDKKIIARACARFDEKMREVVEDLEKQYAHEISDEGIAETLRINYVFFADGRIAGRL